ncbi:hypothetical protein [Rhizobium sp. FKY42]|uniref:hypothetical protein n=1 Tax=Rhizobium sp. FKY42 TaxID=2562310 RepID=UPI0010C01FA1|nr:hypothetical protein [Rhizobium sp. FKY42]
MGNHFREPVNHASMSRRAFIGAAIAGSASVTAAEAVAMQPPLADPLANLSPEERIAHHMKAINEIVLAMGTPEGNGGRRFDGEKFKVITDPAFTIYLTKALCS